MELFLFFLVMALLGGLACRYGYDSRDHLTRDRFIPGQSWLDTELDHHLARELEVTRLRRINDVIDETHANVQVKPGRISPARPANLTPLRTASTVEDTKSPAA